MAALFWVFLLFHCDSILTSWGYLTAAAVLYAVCLATSQLRTWAEHGIGAATIEVLPSGAVCIRISSKSTWYPGQHIFVRLLTWDLHSLTSHPFTICSLPLSARSPIGKGGDDTNEMVLFVQPRGGMTGRLASLAQQRPGRKLRVMLDGPYGGLKHKNLATFDRALLIAGGAGAGFTLPIMESFLQRATPAEPGGNAASSLRVILAVKTEGEYDWYASVVQELLSSYPSSRDLVRVQVYVTGSDFRNDILEKDEEGALDSSESGGSTEPAKHADVGIQHGHRPDLPAIIRETLASPNHGSVGVAVCGPSSMLFDVRQAVAAAQTACLRGEQKEVYLYSEHFSW